MRRSVLALVPLLLLVPPPARGQDLGHDVVPLAQWVRLDLDAGREEYHGSTRIGLRVDRPVERFRFHAREMELDSVVLSGPGGEVETVLETGPRDLVTVVAQEPLELGPYTLAIDFSQEFDTKGFALYRAESGGEWYAFSQFEADGAREAFPCWDEPAFKIPFRFTLRVPEGHEAVTNAPVESRTVENGIATVRFRPTPPLPSYLLAIVTGPLEAVEVAGMSVPGRILTVRGQGRLAAEAARQTPRILAALEAYFGQRYPFEKLDQIAVPEFWPGGMENPGAVTYLDAAILLEPARTTARERRRLVGLIAHELAHMWFGDLVTMSWWDDLWLNEAFASWMGDKVAAEIEPGLEFDLREVAAVDLAMVTDARISARAVRQPVTAGDNLLQGADALAYDKGERVLGMFERWLGAETFRKGVRAYLEAHAWGNATAGDFWKALSSAAGREVGTAMATFLDGPGVPLVRVESLSDGRLRVSQRRFLARGSGEPDPALWKIPVTLLLPDGSTSSFLLEERSRVVSLAGTGEGPPRWVHPNAGERGYYRWEVPPSMLHAMIEDLPDGLGARERVGLLPALSALLTAGEVEGDDLLRAVERAAADPEPAVVESALEAIGTIRTVFVTDRADPLWTGWVRATLEPALERYGLTPHEGERESIATLRPQLLETLATEGHDPRVLAWGKKTARAHLSGRATESRGLLPSALRIAAIGGDAELYAAYRHRFEEAKTPVERRLFLGGLGAFGDLALLDRTLALSLTGELRVREMFAVPRFASESGSPLVREHVYHWMTRNYDALRARVPDEVASFFPRFADGCSSELLAEAEAFFADPAHRVTGIERDLEKVSESVRTCVDLRGREGPVVARYLREAVEGK